MEKNKGGYISTFGLAGAIYGEDQDGTSGEVDLPKAKCKRCECVLSQNSLKHGYDHCSPCRSILRDRAMLLGKPDPFNKKGRRKRKKK